MKRATILLFAASAAMISCNGNNGPVDAGWDAGVYVRPTVPPGGILLETGEFTVPAGGEVLICSYTSVRLDADVVTRELHGYQLRGGHHALLEFTEADGPVDSHVCGEAEMSNFRLIGGGDESHEQALRLPAGMGVKIPAQRQLVIQSHYINPDPVDHVMRDAFVIVPAAPGEVTTIADAFAVSDGDFAMPPHTAYGRTVDCTVDRDMNLVSLLGHTHQYGTHITIQYFNAGSTTPNTIYDAMAGISLRQNPPITYFDTMPVSLHAGDRLRVICDWNNTTDHVLRDPEEMCVGFGYYSPGTGFVSCGTVVETRGAGDAGVTSTNGNAGCTTPWTPDQPCVRSCNTGNELGVGRYCTAGGNQCRNNGSAILCTADFDPTAPGFCTKGCSSDEGCGSGAVCVGDSSGHGCVPVECVAGSDGGTDANVDGSADASLDASMDAAD